MPLVLGMGKNTHSTAEKKVRDGYHGGSFSESISQMCCSSLNKLDWFSGVQTCSRFCRFLETIFPLWLIGSGRECILVKLIAIYFSACFRLSFKKKKMNPASSLKVFVFSLSVRAGFSEFCAVAFPSPWPDLAVQRGRERGEMGSSFLKGRLGLGAQSSDNLSKAL